VSLVQTLLEFLYAGQVTAQEGQFYSLMKLVYDLDIVASIEAEKTNAQPTKFETVPVLVMSSLRGDYDDMNGGGVSGGGPFSGIRPRKRSRLDTFDSLILEDSSHSLQISSASRTGLGSHHGSSCGSSISEQQQLWQKPLVVNSLTASGVEVKQEPEEKPLCEESLDHNHHSEGKNSQGFSKASYGLAVSSGTLSTNSANNNSSCTTTATSSSGTAQLGHFVSVSPGYQVNLPSMGFFLQ
jgi:hypothetical protein